VAGKVKLTHGQAQHSPPHTQDFHLVFHSDVDKSGLPAAQSGVAWCEWKRLDASTDLPAHSSGYSRLPMPRPSSARGRRRTSTGSPGTRSGARDGRTARPSSLRSIRWTVVFSRCWSGAAAFPDPHVVTFRRSRARAVAACRGCRARRRALGRRGPAHRDCRHRAPLGRRYFAFLALAERHPEGAWPLFERYLTTPGAHHAFVAAAVEAARYYPGTPTSSCACSSGSAVNQLLRRFLGPKILESLYVLGEECSLPLFEELLVAGHTDRTWTVAK